MSDCFDHDTDAWESLEQCMDENIVTFKNDGTIIIEQGEYENIEQGEYADIDADDESPEEYSADVEIKENTDSYWIRFGNPTQSSSFDGDWDGKYLLFSSDQGELIRIARHEISEYGFMDAKVSTRPNNNDYVLCLYWRSDERGYELMSRYCENKKIKYRWWKSNADTRAGKYSDKYKQGEG